MGIQLSKGGVIHQEVVTAESKTLCGRDSSEGTPVASGVTCKTCEKKLGQAQTIEEPVEEPVEEPEKMIIGPREEVTNFGPLGTPKGVTTWLREINGKRIFFARTWDTNGVVTLVIVYGPGDCRVIKVGAPRRSGCVVTLGSKRKGSKARRSRSLSRVR